MKNKDKPDYKMWAKKETWTLKEGALLLHAIDPLNIADCGHMTEI